MKKTILFILFIGVIATSFSQGKGNVTVFSQDGDKIYVELNGVRQNQSAEVNVKITGLDNNWYKCIIVSEKNNFEINKNLAVKFDTLMTYRVFEKKGKYKLRFYSENSIRTSTISDTQEVVEFTPIERTEEVVLINTTMGVDTEINTDVSTTTTTTTSSSTTTGGTTTNPSTESNDSFSMNVNIGGVNANVNINGNTSGQTSTNTSITGNVEGNTSFEETTTIATGNGGVTTFEETTTTTTTTTTSSSTPVINMDEEEIITEIEVVECTTSDADITKLKNQLENESFSDDQARIAKMAAKHKCMSVDQISTIASVFTFQDNTLDFLKVAYDNCNDKSNYYQLMEVLTFSSDKEELEEFISSK